MSNINLMNLKLYSWNVLNPNINISIMTWKNKYGSKMARRIAQTDYVRFCMFRKDAIINILKEWLKSDNVVICLQEICNELLEAMRLISGTYIGHTKMINDNCQVTISNVKMTHYDIKLDVGGSVKRCLKSVINNIDIFNVHLHWKWCSPMIKIAGSIIDKNITSEKFIICGDFNNNFQELFSFLDTFDCVQFQHLKGSTGVNTKTGKMDLIDNIFLSSNIDRHSNIRIIQRVIKYTIMYNFEKIINILQKSNFNVRSWIDGKYKNKFISDHRPVAISIDI